jgi:hypothetical protein
MGAYQTSEIMNPYDPTIEESEASSTPATFGWIRTVLLVVSCIFIAVRDLPHGEFVGLIIGLIFVVISWAAIRMRWAYWFGAILSAFILIKSFDFLSGFQTRADIFDRILYGGVMIPSLLAAIMFVTHLFFSGRLRE